MLSLTYKTLIIINFKITFFKTSNFFLAFGFEQNDRKLSKSNSSSSISNENKLAASPQNNVKNIVDKFNSSKVLPKQITTSPIAQQGTEIKHKIDKI